MALEVTMLSSREVVFEGKARSVIVPGEAGVFEILSFHKPIASRLISGTVLIDNQAFAIRRGVVKAYQNKVTVIIEEFG